MLNFDFRRSNRKCSQCERIILPGEVFCSALIEVDDDTERRDYCLEHWSSPPEDCLGWWKCRVPAAEKGKIYWAPRQVLVAYFENVSQQPADADTAYITALLLAQKKILTLEDSLLEEHAEFLILKDKREKHTYKVPVVDVSQQRLVEIQAELSEKLFTDELYETDEAGELDADVAEAE